MTSPFLLLLTRCSLSLTRYPISNRWHSHITRSLYTSPRSHHSTTINTTTGSRNGTTALLVCDIQERFRAHVPHFAEVARLAGVLVSAARICSLPVLVTEQYPRGLGRTAIEVGLDHHRLEPIVKTQFSMCVPAVTRWLASGGHDEADDVECGEYRGDSALSMRPPPIETILVCGLETHVCITHTVRDLLHLQRPHHPRRDEENVPQTAAGYSVHVVADACSSRRSVDRLLALQRLRQLGAVLTSVEASVLELVEDSAHPLFKQLQQLVREPLPDSGLLKLLS